MADWAGLYNRIQWHYVVEYFSKVFPVQSEEKTVPPRKQSIQAEAAPPTNQPQPLIQLWQVTKVYETAAGDFPALAQAQLDSVKAQAAAAQRALDNYDLKAPFAGTVADINSSVYQMVSPQTWVVALADTSQWYVDTSDLTEMDVVKIDVGQAVKVTADALPGVPMTGVVASISAAPNIQGGDVLYTVHIRLNDPDPRLLWGMTMEVTF